MYNNLQKYFSSLVFLIKILIIAGAYYVISDKLLNDSNFSSFLWMERMELLGSASLSFILLLLLFTLINWSLEILKWKTLVSFVSQISFIQAAKQSLASLTASLLTPNRIGEYGAKAIYYPKAYRPKILMLNFLGNAHQMLITMLFGCFGLLILGDHFSLQTLSVSPILGIATVLIILFISMALFQKKWINILRRSIHNFLQIPLSIHKTSFLYAAVRYLIFSHQFYLFLLFFGVDLSYSMAMPIIVSMYLISSVIPGFVLFDWLVKGSVAVTLFRLFGVDDIIVLSITASMWVLNFAFPAMIGSFYVLTFKSSTLVFSESKLRP
jgi:hypothetical protein